MVSPKNWNLQGPGIGFEVMGGAAVIIWPDQRWIAYAAFAIGTVLIVLPVMFWASNTIVRYFDWQSPVLRRVSSSDAPTSMQLVGALVTIIAAIGIAFFAIHKVDEADHLAQARQASDAQQKRIRETRLKQFNEVLPIGQRLQSNIPESDDEYYDWLRVLGQWEWRVLTIYDTAILYGVLSPVAKDEFNKVKSSGLATGYNAHHKRKRGELFERIKIVQSDIRKMTDDLKN